MVPHPSGAPSDVSITTSSVSHNRSKSRQSTVSVQSNASQVLHPHLQEDYLVGTQRPQDSWEMSTEELIAHNSRQLTNPHGYALDPALGTSNTNLQAAMSFKQDVSFMNNVTERTRSPTECASIEDKENTGTEVITEAGFEGEQTGDGSRRKKGSASSQANDFELKRLFRENSKRSLHDVAVQVLRDDKGPKAEKAKQIFGMLWLFSHCKKSSGSVPRSAVFSEYANRCGTERVPLLNPASFGKLVRIIFPGIQTRRLGVRGESKYHYVELTLIAQDGHQRPTIKRAQSIIPDASSGNPEMTRPNSSSIRQQLPTDTALFPSTETPLTAHLRATTPPIAQSWTQGSLYVQPAPWNGSPSQLRLIRRPLQFPSQHTTQIDGDSPIELPDIRKYLPNGTDADAVRSLIAVYRSHCSLAIDNFRYCKTDRLENTYKSLVGLLTVPGSRLLAEPSIAAWIRECDWYKYQKMIPMLDKIILTQVPQKALAHMDNVAKNICGWIYQHFQSQPHHVQEAMLGPANIFVSILERFLRVNQATLEVANVLEELENRDQLYIDWVDGVEPRKVLQNSLGIRGHKRCFEIITQDVRNILLPLGRAAMHTAPEFPIPGPFDDDPFVTNNDRAVSTIIIDKIVHFLGELPTRFPKVEARELLNYIDVVGSNVSRNLSLNGTKSLGTWWRTKIFIDEMSYWLAEKGGFLESTAENLAIPGVQDFTSAYDIIEAYNFPNTSNDDFPPSRPRTAASHSVNRFSDIRGGEYGEGQSRTQRSQSVFHNMPNLSRHAVQDIKLEEEQQQDERRESTVALEDDDVGTTQDDSGIGMGVDDDFGMGGMDGKYNPFVEAVHGSDPADVVVC